MPWQSSEFFSSNYFQIDHVRILSIELELACNEGSCGEYY